MDVMVGLDASETRYRLKGIATSATMLDTLALGGRRRPLL